MSTRKLQQAFEAWEAAGKSLVLATVVETTGSTYSKTGAQMLVTEDGLFQGMLSGGCLEGDLAERAAAVIKSGQAQIVTYDLGMNDEELWGLGVGCDGLMRIFLQPLGGHNNYEPFRSMCLAFNGTKQQTAITVLESPRSDLPAGATMVSRGDGSFWSDVEDRFTAVLSDLDQKEGRKQVAIDGDEISLLVTSLHPPPALLVLGAGLDAEPVVRLADEMGWRVTISDHRPAYVDAGEFAAAEKIHCAPVADIDAHVNFDRFDAVVVMSHHLASDRIYLEKLAASSIPYVGLLGPPDRRKRLLDELGTRAEDLKGRIHGPAGLDIGARGPAPIALSIIAEIQCFLAKPRN